MFLLEGQIRCCVPLWNVASLFLRLTGAVGSEAEKETLPLENNVPPSVRVLLSNSGCPNERPLDLILEPGPEGLPNPLSLPQDLLTWSS